MRSSSVMFPMFIRARNFLRNLADWTGSPGSPLKSGTAMGADMIGCCGSTVGTDSGECLGDIGWEVYGDPKGSSNSDVVPIVERARELSVEGVEAPDACADEVGMMVTALSRATNLPLCRG